MIIWEVLTHRLRSASRCNFKEFLNFGQLRLNLWQILNPHFVDWDVFIVCSVFQLNFLSLTEKEIRFLCRS